MPVGLVLVLLTMPYPSSSAAFWHSSGAMIGSRGSRVPLMVQNLFVSSTLKNLSSQSFSFAAPSGETLPAGHALHDTRHPGFTAGCVEFWLSGPNNLRVNVELAAAAARRDRERLGASEYLPAAHRVPASPSRPCCQLCVHTWPGLHSSLLLFIPCYISIDT